MRFIILLVLIAVGVAIGFEISDRYPAKFSPSYFQYKNYEEAPPPTVIEAVPDPVETAEVDAPDSDVFVPVCPSITELKDGPEIVSVDDDISSVLGWEMFGDGRPKSVDRFLRAEVSIYSPDDSSPPGSFSMSCDYQTLDLSADGGENLTLRLLRSSNDENLVRDVNIQVRGSEHYKVYQPDAIWIGFDDGVDEPAASFYFECTESIDACAVIPPTL